MIYGSPNLSYLYFGKTVNWYCKTLKKVEKGHVKHLTKMFSLYFSGKTAYL